MVIVVSIRGPRGCMCRDVRVSENEKECVSGWKDE